MSAENPVREQLDAYNARDIDRFMRCWADEALYFEFPDRLLASGAAAIRERHVSFASANPTCSAGCSGGWWSTTSLSTMRR